MSKKKTAEDVAKLLSQLDTPEMDRLAVVCNPVLDAHGLFIMTVAQLDRILNILTRSSERFSDIIAKQDRERTWLIKKLIKHRMGSQDQSEKSRAMHEKVAAAAPKSTADWKRLTNEMQERGEITEEVLKGRKHKRKDGTIREPGPLWKRLKNNHYSYISRSKSR
jgi:hypothetical protein